MGLKSRLRTYFSNRDRKTFVVRMWCSAQNTLKPALLSMAMMEMRDSAYIYSRYPKYGRSELQILNPTRIREKSANPSAHT